MILHFGAATDPCSILPGSLRTACEQATNGGSSSGTSSGGALDGVATSGLDTIAKAITGTAAWVLKELTSALTTTSVVDSPTPGS
jgi:hypothetical protein